ncbi:ABC transporter permease [Streptomyces europaeiscabiei]|uniref:ABC transporter permease n=1 Tax=Streptomyces europaeiscabiei TaxID=146819 RepID=A0ABU4NHJ1_9ACTN|nr:ABC transporter permease [Streptomyces europaeiscabiei]MDX2762761.1 ABC transporter permease [Streptomyces europaeiscabiei]MDX2769771.1 ABC transporter permease [Streptomyces europaeiscabiei]MDX3544794.1 ABC transporter permease [Streptomyces europaeiscabiei]MDX3554482.1 ABC transporter permease [Streptomyces europaeiscabiei]MDX3670593.1 ABC transporter permease [Streptomyces europaeiscabiei]
MRNLLAGEWAKAWTGRGWLILVGCGVLMSLLGALGYASQGATAIEEGTMGRAAVTDDIVRSWFMMSLFTSLFGAIFVSREYTSGAIGRSVLMSGGRTRLLAAKVLIATAVGALAALFTAALSLASAWGALAANGTEPAWHGETWLILLGVFAVNTLAAPWGALIGWIVRHQVGAVVTVVALTLVVDPAVQVLVPDAGKYLMTIAQSSVYRDMKPELLSTPLALLVIAGWLAAAGLLARKLFTARDVV